MDMKIKIISGGQTGADRAALDFALENSIPCGGFCPKGRKAEDGTIPAKYPLSETESDQYDERTQLNIENTDGTLIIYQDKFDLGTELTLGLCNKIGKPVILVKSDDEETIQIIQTWIKINKIKVLNVAGPRISNDPGVFDLTIKILRKIF
jgi:hypothetical protein